MIAYLSIFVIWHYVAISMILQTLIHLLTNNWFFRYMYNRLLQRQVENLITEAAQPVIPNSQTADSLDAATGSSETSRVMEHQIVNNEEEIVNIGEDCHEVVSKQYQDETTHCLPNKEDVAIEINDLGQNGHDILHCNNEQFKNTNPQSEIKKNAENKIANKGCNKYKDCCLNCFCDSLRFCDCTIL